MLGCSEFVFLASILCYHLLLVSSVKPKLDGVEVGVEGGEGEGGGGGGGGRGGGGGVGGDVHSDSSDSERLVHPSHLDTRY